VDTSKRCRSSAVQRSPTGQLFVILGACKSHPGSVVEDNGDGTFETIADQTNDDGSREATRSTAAPDASP